MLSNQAKKALVRIGDIICPRHKLMPSFSELGAIEFVDGMLEFAPKQDQKDLNLLLVLLSFMPGFVLRWLVKTMSGSAQKSGLLAPLMRQLNFGLRGLVFSAYYCGKRPLGFKGQLPSEIIGFSLNRIED